jgi:class 3 adenylate cyclase
MRQDEMRPITALFADIVGSTGLGERLGPDEVKALIGECVTRMSRAVEEFGGVIQAFMGDGICAYFGVPAAHEDDPERAARAALRIIGVAAGYAGEVEAAWGIEGFNVRVGVNSGPAAVGLVGGEDSQTVALGDTTNVAARLQSAAQPGSIAIGPGTASRLDERFVLEPLGEVTVKGRSEPVTASRLVGPRPVTEPPSRTPLVGRDREVARLRTAAADLRAGRGQVVLLVGTPGWARRGCSPSFCRSPARTSPGSRAGASPTGRARHTVPSSSSCGPGSGSRRRTPSSRSAPSFERGPARSWGRRRTEPSRTWA